MVTDIVDYELLDFGEGRKLERIGGYCLDRPSPAASEARRELPDAWETSDVRFTRSAGQSEGHWHPADRISPKWHVDLDTFRLNLRLTPFGHVGLFPEQRPNWDWLARQVARLKTPPRVLNLFGYTGGSTLAAAAAGAQVVHLDAAKNIVQWARQNAADSGLGDAPIRWIAEDARRFVSREVRRGNRYEALILDPPTYGHGPKGETWKIARHLMPLLEDCARLLSDRPAFALVTCHSPGYGPAELGAILQQALFGACTSQVHARRLSLTTRGGRRLDAGVVASWPTQIQPCDLYQ